MLFVLVMEVFNRSLNWLDAQGLLTPLGREGAVRRISLYADDVVLFVAPIQHDLLALKSTPLLLGQASGLFANLDKSVATPIHYVDDDIQRVQDILSCRVENFPSRYLGIPLSIFKPKKHEE